METRVERIAGEDAKITQTDIERLQTLDAMSDLKVAQEILPVDFFTQLEAGKWFGIGQGSSLGKAGYIEKLNQVGENYEAEKTQVQQETSEQVRALEFRGTWKYEDVLSAGNRRTRQDEIYNLQVALHLAGYGDMTPDGVWGNSTRRAMQRLVSEMPNTHEGYEDGTIMNQLIFDFLYKKVFGKSPSEEISSKNYSVQRDETVDASISYEKKSIPPQQEEVLLFTRTLKLSTPRMQGEDVKILQQKLSETGYLESEIDGVFGPKTAAALKKYQQEKLGQKGDGVMDMGGKTQSSLEEISRNLPQKTKIPEEKIEKILDQKTSKPEEQLLETKKEKTSVSPKIAEALKEVGIVNPEVQENIEGSLVNIATGWSKGGTGAFISPNIILTAEHVVRDGDTGKIPNIRTIRGADGDIYHVKKISIDTSNNDIAYIETIESSNNYLSYAPDSRKVRTEGILLGFSGSRPRFYAPGITQETQDTEKIFTQRDSKLYGDTKFVDFPAQKGDSGGPIVDKKGNILGIIVRSYEYSTEGESGSIAEPVEDMLIY